MRILKKTAIVLTVVAIIFAFPPKIGASSSFPHETRNVYYYDFSEDGTESLVSYELEFYGEITLEQQIYAVFTNLFENYKKGLIPFVPEGTRLLDAKLAGGLLTLNVSGAIKSYGGGSAYETALVAQILQNAAQFKEIEQLTLLIDGRKDPLPEGTLLFETMLAE